MNGRKRWKHALAIGSDLCNKQYKNYSNRRSIGTSVLDFNWFWILNFLFLLFSFEMRIFFYQFKSVSLHSMSIRIRNSNVSHYITWFSVFQQLFNYAKWSAFSRVFITKRFILTMKIIPNEWGENVWFVSIRFPAQTFRFNLKFCVHIIGRSEATEIHHFYYRRFKETVYHSYHFIFSLSAEYNKPVHLWGKSYQSTIIITTMIWKENNKKYWNKNNNIILNKNTLHKKRTKATAERQKKNPAHNRKIEFSELDYEKCRWIIKKMHW